MLCAYRPMGLGPYFAKGPTSPGESWDLCTFLEAEGGRAEPLIDLAWLRAVAYRLAVSLLFSCTLDQACMACLVATGDDRSSIVHFIFAGCSSLVFRSSVRRHLFIFRSLCRRPFAVFGRPQFMRASGGSRRIPSRRVKHP